jgi:hypothetical protein
MSRYRQPLDPCGRTADQRNIARRNPDSPYQEGHQRRVGFAFGGCSAHPRFQDNLAVGTLFEALDRVTTAAA